MRRWVGGRGRVGRRWVVVIAYLPSERATRADCALGKPEVVREVSAATGAVSVGEEIETGSGMQVVSTVKPLTGCKELSVMPMVAMVIVIVEEATSTSSSSSSSSSLILGISSPRPAA